MSSLGADGRLVSGFVFSGASVGALSVENGTLLDGQVRSLTAGLVSMSGVRARSVEFTGCQLSALRRADGKIARTRFDGCKLLGARFGGVTMNTSCSPGASSIMRCLTRSGLRGR